MTGPVLPPADICIIGAGSSGIVVAKALHDRGLGFDCYEKGSDIGGMWRYGNDNGLSCHGAADLPRGRSRSRTRGGWWWASAIPRLRDSPATAGATGSRACPPRYTLEVDFKDYAGALNADMAGAKSGRPAAMAESRNQPC